MIVSRKRSLEVVVASFRNSRRPKPVKSYFLLFRFSLKVE